MSLDICNGSESLHWAVAEVTPDLAKAFLKRVELAVKLTNEDHDLDNLVYSTEKSDVSLTTRDAVHGLKLVDLTGSAGNFVRVIVGELPDSVPLTPVMSCMYVVCEFGVALRLGTALTDAETCYLPTSALQFLAKAAE
jgi:hypothetical protein